MELAEVLRRRRMARRFDADQPVPREAVDRCLDAALRAPSAGFSQGWDFVVLDQPGQCARFWALSTPPERRVQPDAWLRGVSAAPVLIMCCSDPRAYLDRYAEPDKGWTDRGLDHWPVPYWDVDTGMAAMLILLVAADQSLGALFFGVPADRHTAVMEGFGIPTDRRLVGVVALGREATSGPGVAGSASRRPRRRREEVVHWGRFGASGEAPPRGG
jgi:nitroreductase